MDTLETAYRILDSLETGRKCDYMGKLIGPEALGVDTDKWLDVIRALLDEGYIAGVEIKEDILGNTRVNIASARITLKGAEYLKSNGAMMKFAKIATNVIEIAAPFI